MKKLILACLVVAGTFCNHAKAQSCCTPNNADFKLLASNADFKAAHLDPEPLNYAPEAGSMIKFNTQDAKTGNAFYIPSDQPTNRVLILFHEWWGLNDYIKREAESWQKMLGNVDVYALDLYDGKVATDAATASQLSKGLDEKRAEYLIKGLLSQIGNNKLIATLGWCMGGTWAFKTTLMAGDRAGGCVMYYGFPEQKPKEIAKLKTDVLYIWAARDKFITRDVVDSFGKQVTATGNKFDMHTFDADHAFANPSNPIYDKLAAKQAEQIALKFLTAEMTLE